MSEEQARAFLDTATQALQNGQFAQSLEFVQQSIALKPASAEAFILKGIAHSQLGQPEDATESFKRAIALSPNNVKAYFNLAVHSYATGQKPLAADMAEEALRIEPNHPGARDLLARVEAELGRPPSPSPASGTAVASVQPGSTQPSKRAGVDEEGAGATPQGPPIPRIDTQTSGQAPYQHPPGQAYHRPGYDNPTVHSIAFIEGMGKGWDSMGYALGSVATLIGVINLFRSYAIISQYNWDFGAMRTAQGPMLLGSGGGEILFSLVALLVLIINLIWIILDITDRRGNWLWLLPLLICCCCVHLYGPIMLIYVWKGRD